MDFSRSRFMGGTNEFSAKTFVDGVLRLRSETLGITEQRQLFIVSTSACRARCHFAHPATPAPARRLRPAGSFICDTEGTGAFRPGSSTWPALPTGEDVDDERPRPVGRRSRGFRAMRCARAARPVTRRWSPARSRVSTATPGRVRGRPGCGTSSSATAWRSRAAATAWTS